MLKVAADHDREEAYNSVVGNLRDNLPPVGSRWRHRNGNVYRVVGGGKLEDPLVALVGYCPDEVADPQPWDIWYRHMGVFLDGRFTPIDRGPAFDGSTWDGETPRRSRVIDRVPNTGDAGG